MTSSDLRAKARRLALETDALRRIAVDIRRAADDLDGLPERPEPAPQHEPPAADPA